WRIAELLAESRGEVRSALVAGPIGRLADRHLPPAQRVSRRFEPPLPDELVHRLSEGLLVYPLHGTDAHAGIPCHAVERDVAIQSSEQMISHLMGARGVARVGGDDGERAA